MNAYLCEAIGEAFPDDLVVGEESSFGGRVPAEGRAWFIDPIDGTKDFILKNGEWSIMIGLSLDGEAVAGVVYEPAFERLYLASRGGGAWRVDDGARVRLQRADAKPITEAVVVGSRNHPDARITKVMQRLGITREFVHGSVGCKLARIAEGQADAYFNVSGRCHMWDTCAAEVIIREAGGDLVDFAGAPIRYSGPTTRVGSPFYACTNAVREPISEAVQALAEELRPE